MRMRAGWLDERGEEIDFRRGGNALADAFPERGRGVAGGESQRGRRGGLRGLSGEVVPLPRDDMADAAAWVRHVTEIARDHMDVDMRNRLAGGGTGVEADVVAVWLRVEAEVEEVFCFLHQRHERGLFVVGGIEPCLHDPAGSDENVAGRDRELIEDHEGKVIRAKPFTHRHGEEWRLERGHGRRLNQISFPYLITE
jgi:hypothetical protein